jgi:hypothetical protein
MDSSVSLILSLILSFYSLCNKFNIVHTLAWLSGSWFDNKTSHRNEWWKRDVTCYVKKTIGIVTYSVYNMSTPTFYSILRIQWKLKLVAISRSYWMRTPAVCGAPAGGSDRGSTALDAQSITWMHILLFCLSPGSSYRPRGSTSACCLRQAYYLGTTWISVSLKYWVRFYRFTACATN